MKVSFSLTALLLSTLVASKGLSAFGNDQYVFDDSLAVPGDSPLEYCQPNHENDLLIIQHVNLKPNPPKPYVLYQFQGCLLLLTHYSGQTLTIEAIGTFVEEIEKGAYIQLQVKYGLVRLINMTTDLCEQVKNVDMECPIKEGKTTITKDVDMPQEIPPVSPSVFI
jgi:hypothetical protein